MNFLRRARLRSGLSGRAVALKVGIDPGYYRYIEIGKYNPSPEVSTRIADVMNKITGTKEFSPSEIALMNYRQQRKAKKQSKKAA